MNYKEARSRLANRDLSELPELGDWKAHGFPTFLLTPDVMTLLSLTEIPSVDCIPDIRSPFPTIAVEFVDSGEFPGDEVEHTMLVIYDSPIESESGGFVVSTGGVRVVDLSGYEPEVYRYSYGRVSGEQVNCTCVRDGEVTKPQKPSGITALAINATALISSRPDELIPQGSANLRRFERDAPDIPWSPVKKWLVGKTISIPHGPDDHTTGDRTYRITTRFMVRGHWRLQVCGTERAERKLIWIMPFWKGPRTAEEALMRTYEVHRQVSP